MKPVVMSRSFADAMGFTWPKDWVAIVNGAPVTRDAVLEARRERQRRRLEMIRAVDKQRRIARIDVRYFDQFIYGGWHAYVYLVGRESIWARRGGILANRMVRAFPLAPTTDASVERGYDQWLSLFALRFTRGTFCDRPRGVLDCWVTVSGAGHVEDFLEIIR